MQYTDEDMFVLLYAPPTVHGGPDGQGLVPISGGERGGSSILIYGSGFRPGPLPVQHALPSLRYLISPLGECGAERGLSASPVRRNGAR